MLPSPLQVTIAGTAHSLIRINQDNFGSTYLKKGDRFEVRLQVRHQYEKSRPGARQVERHNIDLTYTTFPADSKSEPIVVQAYTVMRMPRGELVAPTKDVLLGLQTLLNAQAEVVLGWGS